MATTFKHSSRSLPLNDSTYHSLAVCPARLSRVAHDSDMPASIALLASSVLLSSVIDAGAPPAVCVQRTSPHREALQLFCTIACRMCLPNERSATKRLSLPFLPRLPQLTQFAQAQSRALPLPGLASQVAALLLTITNCDDAGAPRLNR